MRTYKTVVATLILITIGAFQAFAQTIPTVSQKITSSEVVPAPISLEEAALGKVGSTYLIAGGTDSDGQVSSGIYALQLGDDSWKQIGELDEPHANAAFTATGDALFLVGGEIEGEPTASVLSIKPMGDSVEITSLPDLPTPLTRGAANVSGGALLVAGSMDSKNVFYSLDLGTEGANWTELRSWSGAVRWDAYLVKSVETQTLIGGVDDDGLPDHTIPSYDSRYGWAANDGATALDGRIVSASKLGDAHAITLVENADSSLDAYLYHMVGETWVALGGDFVSLPSDSRLVPESDGFTVLSDEGGVHASFGQPETNYGWWDHISVALYFAVMLYIGFHFSKQSSNTEDYFRGGHKIPWWATGMSLFATGASAMSLMAMPGKSYAGNWTFFAISIYSILALPIAMYFFAPLIRKLNFGTAFEYLERRFGLSVRIIGSTIFAVYQILGRMGGVLLLPSFALEAIAGIPMHVSVPIMGLVTIAYTFLGGLSAVIWTDTIQGLVMVSAVAGCLILVFFRIDMPFADIWTTLEAQDKLHVFDWGFSLTDENVFTVFVGIVFVTMLGIGDQNFVQRVQCGDSLSSTRKAIATQMAVAVPINILLFSLGTALFLFYKGAPESLNPVMRNDGIYPFFAAQQLPPGISGLVIAALLAATMSTISSSICSVSNLAVDDFYKRFSAKPTERKAVLVGRIVTLLVGLFGIASAFYLNSFETPSIWDLALRVVSIVTATTVGIYTLGLFTKKANEIGVLAGIVAGMATTYWISVEGLLVFWLYPVAGSLITVVVGYIVSLATGGNQKDIDGLTVATLKNRTGGLDD